MRTKRIISAIIAAVLALGTCAAAKDNIYAYNKFISTVLGVQLGYCDVTASFAGHENDYENVNDYFSGLVSAFYTDIDDDRDNELITVDTQHGTAVYRMADNGVVFLSSIDFNVIENYGDSYTNVFTVPVGQKQYVGTEHYDKAVNEYFMLLHELNPETDELKKVLEIKRTDNEDGAEEKVWAGNKTYYAYTNGGGMKTVMNTDGYKDCAEACAVALNAIAPSAGFSADIMKERINGTLSVNNAKLDVDGVDVKTFVRAENIRRTEKPVVVFWDNSNLEELKIKPDLVTVVLDGQTLQFPTQDPIIIDGRTLVPMRTIFEALGADVQWLDDGTVQSIVATTEETTINMTINDAKFFVNGEEKTLDVPACLINDKTLVPIRAISESLGCYVGWDEVSKTVVIQSQTDIAN